jgi:hypothetical protein
MLDHVCRTRPILSIHKVTATGSRLYTTPRLRTTIPVQLVTSWGWGTDVPLGYWRNQRKLESIGAAWFEALIAIDYPQCGEGFCETIVNDLNLCLGIWKSKFLGCSHRTGKLELITT